MALTKTQSGMWVWLFDIHSPKIHKPTWNAALHFISDNKKAIRGVGKGGDQNDNGEISHHNKKKIIFREKGAYKRNTEYYDKNVLTPLEMALQPDTHKVWIEGNHDDWENQLVQEQPELEGTVERRGLLNLDERGWEFVPTGNIYKLGKLGVIHGETLTGLGNQGSTYHAKKAVESYGRSLLYGHLHSPQSFARIAPFVQTDKHMAWCSPIIGFTNPSYLRNRPTAWVNGFTIVEVRDDGNFNVMPIVVTGGKFSFGGKTYGG
jgi:hypothetical protein